MLKDPNLHLAPVSTFSAFDKLGVTQACATNKGVSSREEKTFEGKSRAGGAAI